MVPLNNCITCKVGLDIVFYSSIYFLKYPALSVNINMYFNILSTHEEGFLRYVNPSDLLHFAFGLLLILQMFHFPLIMTCAEVSDSLG